MVVEKPQTRITLGNRRGRRPSAATVLSAVGRYIRQNTVIGVRGTRRRKVQCGCTGEGYGGELCQRDAGYRRSATGKDRSFVDDNLVGGWVMFEELVKEDGQWPQVVSRAAISPVSQHADLPEDELTGRVEDTPIDEEVRC